MTKSVRTRFAPSPTGFLHVGGVRTALFAWLLARQNNGQFILRLEDTDQKREVVGADKHIVSSLTALGLDIDEGPIKQSERLEIYKVWAQKLIESGRAYADDTPPEEIQRFRDQDQRDKKPFLYRNHVEKKTRDNRNWDGKTPLRFRSEPKAYNWQDAVMGELTSGPEVIDDFVLVKSDGFPTYNFAHIVDDAEMNISHVIRGQEFLASVPNYLNLYEALALKPPALATMPHILNEHGNKKLSKRDGAKDVLDYVRDGFLPEALVSFIATLGWNDGTEQEVFSLNELIEKFSLDRIGRSGAHFDEQRLKWVNGEFIRKLPLGELFQRAEDFWPKTASKSDNEYKKQVLGLVQERLKFLSELPELTAFFFEDLAVDSNLITSHKQLKKLSTEELKGLLKQASQALEQSDFTVDDLQARLNKLLEKTGQKPAVLFSLIRIATTQAPASPGLAETMQVLGKETILHRIEEQIKAL